jgi:hypothetical protein
MGLENTTIKTIANLDNTSPTGGDPKNQGDDHLRYIKAVLKAIFPGVGGNGFATAITAKEVDLNNGFTPIGGIILWSGTIAAANALTGWHVCDGTNGTPNLTDKFVIGAGVDNAGISNTAITGVNTKTGGNKDSTLVEHAHSTTTTISVTVSGTTGNDSPDHTHNVPYHQDGGNYSGGGDLPWDDNSAPNSSRTTTGASTRHTHSFSGSGSGSGTATSDSQGSSATNTNLPPYYALAYIMRIA